MITIQTDRQSFAYDIHSLVKAFYPEQDVHVEREVYAGQNTCEGQKVCAEQMTCAGRKTCAEQDVPPVQEEKREQKGMEAPEEETRQSLKLVVSFVTAESFEKQSTDEPCTICVSFRQNGEVFQQDETVIPPGMDRKEVKNELKRLLYRMLSEQTGRTLPWGTLTGIRPTKIPMSLLEQGWRNAQIAQYMRDTYYCGNEKTALAIAIANRERHILKNIDFKNGYSLYVGIPFCPSICLYCSFSSNPLHLWKDQVDAYLDALCHEIDFVSKELSDRVLNTVYIGGGTPTTLEPHQMDRLLTKLEQSFDFGKLREYTVEAGRPDSITREKLQVLRDHGITRISVNPQTMNQATLDLIGRKHTVEETVAAFGLARDMGFDDINMDLIVGLPGEGMAEVEHTMQELAKLAPDSVTVHSLAVKRASRLNQILREGVNSILTMTNSQEIMEMTARYARESGLFPYYLYRQKNMAGNFENVGYAREGKEGIYNILIMEEMQSILALGAGAATKLVFEKDRIERIENVKDIRNYIDRIDEMIARKRARIMV